MTVRWAALLHDIGKVSTFTRDETGRGHFYGHASAGAELAEQVLLGLKAPTRLRCQVVELIGAHMTRLQPDKKQLRRQLSRLGWEQLEREFWLQQADMSSKGVTEPGEGEIFPEIRRLLEEIRREDSCLKVTDLAVNGEDLMALGYQGRQIGERLHWLLEQVLEETLPNDRQALLLAAKEKQE